MAVAELIAQRLPNTRHAGGRRVLDHPGRAVVLGMYTAVHQYSLVRPGRDDVGIHRHLDSELLARAVAADLLRGETRNLGLPYFPAGGMYDLAVGPTVRRSCGTWCYPATALATVIAAGYIRTCGPRCWRSSSGLRAYGAGEGPVRAADAAARTPSRTPRFRWSR